jgi:gliding motility-associated-like protein
MKIKPLCAFFCCFFFLVGFPAGLLATHIIGGEINYTYVGNNQYEITLQLFRDCDTGIPDFDDPAEISIRNSSNFEIDQIFMQFRNNDTINFAATACSSVPPSACIHTTTYRETKFLPFRTGGYHLVYQICCRNQDILNITNPTNTEAAYYTHISETSLLSGNSAAKFDEWPEFYICNGYAMSYDHSATDVDGDSIAYELYTPFDVYPSLVLWGFPYSLTNMMGLPNPFGIDPVTGILTGIPHNNGTYIVGIVAKEYRNGLLISRTRRDFQFIVAACTSTILADFSFDIPPCNNALDIPFNNLSIPSFGPFIWDFGDNTSSTVANPVHAFPDTGLYTVQLICAQGEPCEDSATYDVYVQITDADIDVVYAPVVCNDNKILLIAQNVFSSFNQITNYIWSPDSSILAGQGTDSVWMSISNPGFAVNLIVSNNFGCADTNLLTQINIPVDTVLADFDSVSFLCNTSLTVPFNNTSFTSSNQFLWTFNGQDISSDIDPVYTFPDTGLYTVSLIAGVGLPCQDTIEKEIYIPLTGVAVSASDYQTICSGDTILLYAQDLLTGLYNIVDYQWSPASSIISGQGTDSVLLIANADINYSVIATNSENCKDTAFAPVNVSAISPVLVLTADPYQIYLGQYSFLNANFDADHTYVWLPDTSLSDFDIHDPIATPRENHTYYLTVNNSYGCFIMDSVTIEILPPVCDNPVVFVPSAFSPDGDGHNDVLMVNGNNITELTIKIFNRWGQKVFESIDQNMGWDGYYNGKLLPPDVYGYFMECTCDDNSSALLKGNITLLR